MHKTIETPARHKMLVPPSQIGEDGSFPADRRPAATMYLGKHRAPHRMVDVTAVGRMAVKLGAVGTWQG